MYSDWPKKIKIYILLKYYKLYKKLIIYKVHEARPDRFMAVDLEGGVGSEFNITFKMRTRQSQALLLYIADEPQVNISC